MYMRFCPFHNLNQLRPVIDFLEIHLFNRSTGNDKAVIILVFNIIKGLVKFEQMVFRRVCRFMSCCLNQVDLNLDRRVGKTAENLCFRNDFGRHEIEDRNAERADVLGGRAMVRHDKDVFAFQHRAGR